ncbi:hypothetical protein ACFQHW_07110 [Lapidilactobacillus achengensis]|uniref:Uncharacterized protein n=1 Tax=Lapidilactobacillus achengensis TaxID=2486000 RepID=A0ABW1UNP4_9LACO|nr:hypothetical protein [Lapidilactobacillus achengensis]
MTTNFKLGLFLLGGGLLLLALLIVGLLLYHHRQRVWQRFGHQRLVATDFRQQYPLVRFLDQGEWQPFLQGANAPSSLKDRQLLRLVCYPALCLKISWLLEHNPVAHAYPSADYRLVITQVPPQQIFAALTLSQLVRQLDPLIVLIKPTMIRYQDALWRYRQDQNLSDRRLRQLTRYVWQRVDFHQEPTVAQTRLLIVALAQQLDQEGLERPVEQSGNALFEDQARFLR